MGKVLPIVTMGFTQMLTLILKLFIIMVTLGAIILLILHQIVTQVKEYAFYKNNGWDFSIDSGLDKIEERIGPSYAYGLTNWQRLYLFRPFYIALLIFVTSLMIVSLL